MLVRKVNAEKINMNKIRNQVNESRKIAYERLNRYQEQRTINIDCNGEIGQKYYPLQDVVKPVLRKLKLSLRKLFCHFSILPF